MSIKELIKYGATELDFAGIDLSQLESEILLAFALGISREALFLDLDLEVSEGIFRNLIERRKRHEPIAYLTNSKEFYGRNFYVDRNVLIPRPDTETLVSSAIDFSRKSKLENINIVDMGTGSGIIGITLGLELPNSNILAIDNSEKALKVAENNAKNLGAENVSFVKSDLFKDIKIYGAHLIVANLPYVPTDEKREMMKDVIDFEPVDSIFSGSDGLNHYRRLIDQIVSLNIEFDVIFVEIFHTQSKILSDLFLSRIKNIDIEVIKNLAGYDRVLKIAHL